MIDLTPAERNLLAWHTLPCRYAPCAQPVGRRCVAASGTRTSPHAVRLSDLDIWLSRQPEVDALNALVASLRASNDQLTAALKTSDDKNDMALQRLANMQLDLTHAQADLAAALARIAELETPPKPAETVIFTNPGSRATLPAGKRGGGAGVNKAYTLSKPVTAATLTYDLMFEAPFDWSLGGKLPGLEGVVPGTSPMFPTGGKADPDHLGWSGRLMWLAPGAGAWKQPDGTKRKAVVPVEIVAYVYHPGQLDAYGDNVWTGYTPKVGEWITVETHHVLNTPGKADGVLRISLGGKVVVDIDDYVYRTRADVQITHLLDARFAGGATDAWTAPVDRHISVRNFRVTTPA